MPYRYLGNSLASSGNRLFYEVKENGKVTFKLVSWIDKRCSRCGKFLKKKNPSNRCINCYKEESKQFMKEYYENNRIGILRQKKEYYNRKKEKAKFSQ